MKNFLIVCLVAFAAWSIYTNKQERGAYFPGRVNSSSPVLSTPQFSCDGREYCSQMRSYEEAKFFIENCPNTKMDGDNDGVPCERQFGM